MSVQGTLCIIKPDASPYAVRQICLDLEEARFSLLAKMVTTLPVRVVERFYAEHKGQYFYDRLIQHMSSGPLTVMLLERNDAILELRRMMGSTDPQMAAPGTFRHDYGTELPRNAIHGSDSEKSAKREIKFFFPWIFEHLPPRRTK